MQIIMNKEDHKKMLDQFERSNKQREDSKETVNKTV